MLILCVYLSVNWVYYSLVFNNPVTHPINLHNSILVCIFVIPTSRIVFSSFHIFHFCPYLGRGFYFNLYLLYLKKLFMEKYVKATKYGRLYIETKDFFNIPSVIETINKLKNCSVVRRLEYEKEQRRKIELEKAL